MRDEQFRKLFELILATDLKAIKVVATIQYVKDIMPVCETNYPDLLIADTRLHDGDCFATAKELTEKFPSLKMIFTSLSFHKDVKGRLEQAGACGYFRRVDDRTKMIDVIQQVIDLPKSIDGYKFQL